MRIQIDRYFEGKDIYAIRVILGMNQNEFSELIRVSQQLVSAMESGKIKVSRKTTLKIYKEVFKYIDEDTLYKILDGEIEL